MEDDFVAIFVLINHMLNFRNKHIKMPIDKRAIFEEYLIKKLGFVNDTFLKEYLNYLMFSAKKFKYLGAVKSEEELNQYRSYVYINDLHIPTNYNWMDFLCDEYNIKKNQKITPKKSLTSYVSATDIANFTFCPVSFSISRTFDVAKIESAYLGEDLHKERRLVSFIKDEFQTDEREIKQNEWFDNGLKNENNLSFFNDIKNSKLIFYGHTEGDKKYFKSLKGDFVGQPDYIFSNKEGQYFVVEEKFQQQEYDSEKQRFYSNHNNQLISYLHGIKDFDLQYGYLVYWKFEFNGGIPNIQSCHVKKILRDNKSKEIIISAYKGLKELIKTKEILFDINKRNANKCANCVVSMLCGHKTGNFESLRYPYDIRYLKLKFVEYPKELRKDYIPPDDSV